jgi:hypothetical protein
MSTQTQTSTLSEQDQGVEKKIHQLWELLSDAPELGKKALGNALHELKSQASELPPPVESAGRVGAHLGKVSELTDDYGPARSRWCEAFARVPEVVER